VEENRSAKNFINAYEWLESLTHAAVVVVLLFLFVFRTSVVSGISMEKTLQGGDMLIVSRLGGDVEVGDIVVVTKPYSHNEPIIKRVIATEGQNVDINFDMGVVFVDGELIEESYVNSPTNDHYDMEFPQTVPEGHIFCLGDNRNDSYDSRAAEIGMIDERYVLGKVYLRVMPFDKFGHPDK